MVRRDELRAQWAARPPSVRAWAVLALLPSILQIVWGPSLAVILSLPLTGLLVWGVWEGYRIAWILALASIAVPLVSMLSASTRLFLPIALLAVSAALLLAPSTQEWVNRQEVRRGHGPGGGASRRRAA